MKNKSFSLTLLMLIAIVFASCAGSRGYGGGTHRKGYGCPATSAISTPAIEKNKA